MTAPPLRNVGGTGAVGVEIVFKNGIVEAMPFPDGQFDAVLSTVMLHHLGPKAHQLCAQEVRRVLKPGGRVLAIDFARPAEGKKGLLDLSSPRLS
jgi:ubiquinone/menaquinone biosynthesis C-methylase UbiE